MRLVIMRESVLTLRLVVLRAQPLLVPVLTNFRTEPSSSDVWCSCLSLCSRLCCGFVLCCKQREQGGERVVDETLVDEEQKRKRNEHEPWTSPSSLR